IGYLDRPFKFLLISFATAVERTRASVLGYVTSFFSYNSCTIRSVSSGLILKRLEQSFWSSARLYKRGGFFFSFFFSIDSTTQERGCSSERYAISSSAFSFSLNPFSLYRSRE